MSRHREMLRALVRLGKTPEDIAAEVPMNRANIARTLGNDWPIQPRYVGPLETYVARVLALAYDTAEPPERVAIADAFIAAFGRSILDKPRINDEAQRATYVAWLLGIKWELIFPHGPECNEEADEHLTSEVTTILNRLIDEARQSSDRCPEAMRYLSTLSFADDVMAGRESPAANGGSENVRGYRRGLYVFRSGPNDKNKKGTVPR